LAVDSFVPGGPPLARLGLPHLAAANLPAEYRELRLSRTYGLAATAEDRLLRIVHGPNGTSAEVIYVRPVFRSPDSLRLIGWDAWVARALSPRDGRRLLAVLDSLAIETMSPPDYADAVMDGPTLSVELRRGKVYRQYSVDGLGYRGDTVAVLAALIGRIVDSLVRPETFR